MIELIENLSELKELEHNLKQDIYRAYNASLQNKISIDYIKLVLNDAFEMINKIEQASG